MRVLTPIIAALAVFSGLASLVLLALAKPDLVERRSATALYHDALRFVQRQPYMAEDRDAVITCWGDSLTFGGLDTYRHNYCDLLNDLYHRPTINLGIRSATSRDIARRMLDRPKIKGPDAAIIWVGRNNCDEPDQVEADIAAMVGSLDAGSRYLILGILNADAPGEGRGGETHGKIVRLNDDLARTYGDRFIPVRSILMVSANRRFPHDIADVEQDIVPGSLRSDILHLNDHGQAIVANAVEAALVAQGW